MSDFQNIYYIFLAVILIGFTGTFITATSERLKYRKALYDMGLELAELKGRLIAMHYLMGIKEIKDVEEEDSDGE